MRNTVFFCYERAEELLFHAFLSVESSFLPQMYVRKLLPANFKIRFYCYWLPFFLEHFNKFKIDVFLR